MSTLHELQRSFAQFILGDETQMGSASLSLKKSSPSQFKDEQRLQVYRNNFVISLREALAGVYPVVFKLVGEVFFQHAANEYIKRHSSRTGNLHNFGDAFAVFLDCFPGLETLPYLPDVARLEWAHHQVFHTGESSALNLPALAELDEKQIAGLTFQISESCRLLDSDYPVLSIWQANQDGNENTISLDEGGVQYVVLRHGQQIEFHLLSAGFFTLIDSLAQSKTFSIACDDALAIESGCDIAAALHFLVEQKIVSGFSGSQAAVLN